MSMEVNK